ncbi:MAG TPA: WYL domain-containing protein [Gaiellaceae bacterium]
MSHDTDKLIRQLSLVAFLMAERRSVTARDIKGSVEGYQEMSDEAFARRFYSDRAELVALGVPLHSQRDEYTGEELYKMHSESYFLPQLDLKDDELAALQTALYLLEGKFAYAEPLRLALQNLALGRPGFAEAPTDTALRVEVLDPEYSLELAGRLGKLEGAISKQRTIKFAYWSISRDEVEERSVNPYALFQDNGAWYVVGQDLGREDIRTFRVSRMRGEIRFATRRERDFRPPAEFQIEAFRDRPPWQIGERSGEAKIEVAEDTAWWVERTYGDHGEVEDGVFSTEYSNLGQLASWILRQDGRAAPQSPPKLRQEVARGLRLVRDRHEGAPPKLAKDAKPLAEEELERVAGPVAPERFAVLQALLAYLLDRCGEEPEAVIAADDLIERFHIPPEELEEHLSLLNLVNFGGGCYAVYAELANGSVHVDKELFGDTFRAPPRLTPLEARAIRLALEFVGPMIAADARSPLDRVRRKLEETFGEFDLGQTPASHAGEAEVDLVATLTQGIRERLLVELDYLKEGEESTSAHLVEPYSIERRLPFWYVHTWDRTRGGERSFRLDRMRSARLLEEQFEPRMGFEPRGLRDARPVQIWYSPEVARWRLERGTARRLEDGSAVEEVAMGGEDWLIGEILSFRGEAVVREPEELRRRIAARARELQGELGLARVRVPSAG